MSWCRDFFLKRNHAFSLYDLFMYGHALAQESLGVIKFTILGRSSFNHHNYTLSLSDLCLRVEEKQFKEIMHFYYMTYSLDPALKPLPSGLLNLQFL